MGQTPWAAAVAAGALTLRCDHCGGEIVVPVTLHDEPQVPAAWCTFPVDMLQVLAMKDGDRYGVDGEPPTFCSVEHCQAWVDERKPDDVAAIKLHFDEEEQGR